MTHKELVQIAYKWIVKNGGVGVAFREIYSVASERPDVLGFNSGESIVIECKASRADFLKDMKKKHRAKGMGNWRFYCCPKGLIQVGELPPRWGLIYVDENGKARVEFDIRKKKVFLGEKNSLGVDWIMMRAEENCHECDHKAERAVMYTALRRLFLRGRMDEIYTMP